MTKTGINWDLVQAQLRASEMALQDALAENPARTRSVYRRRAEQLAQTGSQTAVTAVPIQALIFMIRSESYAIRLHELAEVLSFRECTPVPGAATEFLGVISQHGELRPVVELARVIQLQGGALPGGSDNQTPGFILMLRKPYRQIGLRVDRVEGLREIPADGFDSHWQGQYTSKVAGEALLLLDLVRLLSAIP